MVSFESVVLLFASAIVERSVTVSSFASHFVAHQLLTRRMCEYEM